MYTRSNFNTLNDKENTPRFLPLVEIGSSEPLSLASYELIMKMIMFFVLQIMLTVPYVWDNQ